MDGLQHLEALLQFNDRLWLGGRWHQGRLLPCSPFGGRGCGKFHGFSMIVHGEAENVSEPHKAASCIKPRAYCEEGCHGQWAKS
jgi:hypothetical protein